MVPEKSELASALHKAITPDASTSSSSSSSSSSDDVIEVNLMKEELEGFSYTLPRFESLAEDFDIEKAYEKDSSFLLREIRKIMIEKLSAYLQLFETFMNPSSPPMFVFAALRSLEAQDKLVIKRVYQELSQYQLWSVKLDTVYDEAKEAEFISKSYSHWQSLKVEIYALLEKLEHVQDETADVIKGGYFN